ncbi:MAG: hypothetical protein V2B20_07545 [Pseudomonadota bacterium]
MQTAEPGLSTFSQGQTFRAVVIAENARDQFTLEVGSSRFVVQAKFPLTPGQSLNLQVLSTSPEIKLQVAQDTAGSFLGRSLASTGNSPDIASFFTILQQIPLAQLQKLSGSSLQALQQFAQLQQNMPGQDGNVAQQGATGQTLSSSEYGPKLLSHIFEQLATQIDTLLLAGKDQAALAGGKAALQDISLLFQGGNQLSPTAMAQLDQLSPSIRQLFETMNLLQPNQNIGQGGKEAALNQLFQQLQLAPDNPFSSANLANTLTTLKSGLTELVSLMKGPENLLQIFSTNSLQSGLLTQAQAEGLLISPGATAGAEANGGELQQLVNKLGLNLEGMLAAGNLEGAVKTVKFALIELVQNLSEQSKLHESGKQALNSLEFFQLAQLQTARQDTLILPIPLPFLLQGYLVVENYEEQSDKGSGKREMPKHFSLFLKLSPLGNLKIDFLSSEDGLYIRFNSESKEVSDFIAGFKDDLNKAISGPLIHSVSFSESAEDPLTALVKRSMTGEVTLINTKI